MAEYGTDDTERLDAWIGDRLDGFGTPLTAEGLGTTPATADALTLVEQGPAALDRRVRGVAPRP